MTDYNALPYKDYLLTEHWWQVSEERKYIDGNRCAKCGSTDRLEVHHLRYVDEFGGSLRGREDPKLDLITLCRSCHEAVSQPVPKGTYDFTVIGAELIDDGARLKATLSVDYEGIAHCFVEAMRCDDGDFTKIARFRKSIGLRTGEYLRPSDIIGLKGRALIGVKDPLRYNQNNVINFFLKEDYYCDLENQIEQRQRKNIHELRAAAEGGVCDRPEGGERGAEQERPWESYPCPF